ncbi:hypothetical protein AAC387_Pa12g0933 [Persea americana]
MMAARIASPRASSTSSTSLLRLRGAPRPVSRPEEPPTRSRDLEDVELPHNDPLALTLKLQNFLVQRVLVDPGSSSEILYYDCFQKLKLKDEDLQTALTPLVGFSSKPVYPKGKISLRVQIGGASRQVDFLVVDVPSPYNVIMGKTWLDGMEAVPSTRHQKLKFPLENPSSWTDVITIKSDQHMARQYLMSVLLGEAESSQVHVAELDREAELGDVGRAPAQKSIEDLTEVRIHPADPDRLFLIGSQLPEPEKTQLLDLLLENREVFAWTPYEIPGIDPAIMRMV